MNIIFGISIILAEIIIFLIVVFFIIKKIKTIDKGSKHTYPKKDVRKEEPKQPAEEEPPLPDGIDIIYDKIVSLVSEASLNTNIDNVYDYEAFKNKIIMTVKEDLYTFIDENKLESKLRKCMKKNSSEKLDTILYSIIYGYLEKEDVSIVIGGIYDRKIYGRLQEMTEEETATVEQNKKYGDVGDNFIPEDLGIARPKNDDDIIDISNLVTEDDLSEIIEDYE